MPHTVILPDVFIFLIVHFRSERIKSVLCLISSQPKTYIPHAKCTSTDFREINCTKMNRAYNKKTKNTWILK